MGIGNIKEKMMAKCPKNKTFLIVMIIVLVVIGIILIMNFAKGDETL